MLHAGRVVRSDSKEASCSDGGAGIHGMPAALGEASAAAGRQLRPSSNRRLEEPVHPAKKHCCKCQPQLFGQQPPTHPPVSRCMYDFSYMSDSGSACRYCCSYSKTCMGCVRGPQARLGCGGGCAGTLAGRRRRQQGRWRRAGYSTHPALLGLGQLRSHVRILLLHALWRQRGARLRLFVLLRRCSRPFLFIRHDQLDAGGRNEGAVGQQPAKAAK